MSRCVLILTQSLYRPNACINIPISKCVFSKASNIQLMDIQSLNAMNVVISVPEDGELGPLSFFTFVLSEAVLGGVKSFAFGLRVPIIKDVFSICPHWMLTR